MTDILIIGAGCAGLTAAIYGIRAGYSVLVLEKLSYGGQLITTSEVENYPAIEKISGPELAHQIFSQAKKMGAEVRFEKVVRTQLTEKVKIVVTEKEHYEARTVIIANGAERRKLGCPGEAELTGRGVSYCATCDGAFFKGKSVVVVGGGNTALEDALFLSNICDRVTIVHRRDHFTAEKALQRSLQERKNVKIIWDSIVEQIEGRDKVERIILRNVKSGQIVQQMAEGIFIAVGLVPDNKLFSELNLDAGGYIVADENCLTNCTGVFAAGDTRTKQLRQIITAAADGSVAAFAAGNYLNQL